MSGQLVWTNTPPGVAASLTVTGNSGPIAVAGLAPPGTFPGAGPPGSSWQNFYLSLVTGTPTGTSPTLALHVDGVDAFGNVLPDLVTLPAGFSLTTVAGAAQCSFGLNGYPTSAGPPGLIACVPALIQVRWVLGGTTPSYPNPQISLYGR